MQSTDEGRAFFALALGQLYVYRNNLKVLHVYFRQSLLQDLDRMFFFFSIINTKVIYSSCYRLDLESRSNLLNAQFYQKKFTRNIQKYFTKSILYQRVNWAQIEWLNPRECLFRWRAIWGCGPSITGWSFVWHDSNCHGWWKLSLLKICRNRIFVTCARKFNRCSSQLPIFVIHFSMSMAKDFE